MRKPCYRKCADLTFPIYVLHFPLIVLYCSIFGLNDGNTNQMWSAIILVLLVCIIIGTILERNRFIWNLFFKKVFLSLRNIIKFSFLK